MFVSCFYFFYSYFVYLHFFLFLCIYLFFYFLFQKDSNFFNMFYNENNFFLKLSPGPPQQLPWPPCPALKKNFARPPGALAALPCLSGNGQ